MESQRLDNTSYLTYIILKDETLQTFYHHSRMKIYLRINEINKRYTINVATLQRLQFKSKYNKNKRGVFYTTQLLRFAIRVNRLDVV